MVETVVNYKPQYIIDRHGKRTRFRFDRKTTDFFRDEEGNPLPAPDGQPYLVRGRFVRDNKYRLIPDRHGKPFRLWRSPLDPKLNEGRKAWEGIKNPDDIWNAIRHAGEITGSTGAPPLQPIETRLIMLQSGMRAPMGVKIKGPDQETIDEIGRQIEGYLREVPSIDAQTVNSDRLLGKPYLEIDIDREAIARYGIKVRQVQNVIESAIGGRTITTTVEGRERYPVRVRYVRELRDNIEALERTLVPAPDGAQIP
jgi:Cu(I)/Ag(I) efflux system membrane protein CusA/SilA